MQVQKIKELPRLLERDDPPPLARSRWYWRYVHRWRKRLFHVWRQDVPDDLDDTAIAHSVDDLIAVALLLDYLRRSGFTDLPTIQNVCQSVLRPTVPRVAGAIAEAFSSPLLIAAFEPGSFADSPLVPQILFRDGWERRIRDATWLLYRDKSLPLSFFCDFHQVCVGNPLNTQSSNLGGQGTRRARGVYYTPAPIVDYLVSAMLDRALADRNLDEVLQLRLLDPSCGCGAFLIGCLRYFIHWLELRLDYDDESVVRYSLKLMERVLHGCDIDPQAVRWTIRLLLLATREGLKSRIDCQGITGALPVPDLKGVIRCGSFLDPIPAESTEPSALPFDVILGGPPFVRLEQLHRTQRNQLPLYRRRYLSARQGQFDLYMLFIEQALDLLNQGGHLAFSLSNSFLRSDSGRIVRGYIAANASVDEIVEFDDPRTYADAATQIVLLRLRRERQRCRGRHVLVKGRGNLRRKLEHLATDRPHSDISIRTLPPDATASSRWKLATSDDC